MFKKINSMLLVVAICFTVVGCTSNPSDNSQYSSEIIVEEIITETVTSNADSTPESSSSEDLVSSNSSQPNTSSQQSITSKPENTNSTPSQTAPSQATPSQSETVSKKRVIPEGGIYICTSKGVVLTAGQKFPETCEERDVYTYGDYKYIYQNSFVCGYDTNTDTYIFDDTVAGWAVGVLDRTKTVYGEILETINEKPVVSLGPKNDNFMGAFESCMNLVIPPKIPDTVINLYQAFYMCRSLAKAPEIPSGVINMRATFIECFSLVTAPTIPNSVTNMQSTFARCISLTTAPTIPSSVTNMLGAFTDCTSLSGTIAVNANPTQYASCFYNVDMSKITLTGSATKETLNNIGATGENYNLIP